MWKKEGKEESEGLGEIELEGLGEGDKDGLREWYWRNSYDQ